MKKHRIYEDRNILLTVIYNDSAPTNKELYEPWFLWEYGVTAFTQDVESIS